VREGERVLFHLLNPSATESIRLALSGHKFLVIGMDGNPVPQPQTVDVLDLGAAERIDAIVEMSQPGVWILGTTDDDDRKNGLGVVVEYAGRSGQPTWVAPAKSGWDHTIFGRPGADSEPDQNFDLVIRKIPGGHGGFNRWTINGKSWPHTDPLSVKQGRRYRLTFRNESDDAHPLHLYRHTVQLTKINGKATGAIMKDTVVVNAYKAAGVDFVADDPGLTLLHCHQQLHQDFGFMMLVKYV
jgi:FtsP/CotA-like multicopper oxidase with cupredoxin domain